MAVSDEEKQRMTDIVERVRPGWDRIKQEAEPLGVVVAEDEAEDQHGWAIQAPGRASTRICLRVFRGHWMIDPGNGATATGITDKGVDLIAASITAMLSEYLAAVREG